MKHLQLSNSPEKLYKSALRLVKKYQYDAYQIKIIGTMKTGFGCSSIKVEACVGGYEFLAAQNIDYLHT